MDWYYALGQEQTGPVSEGEFEGLVQSGVITPQTLVWHAGMADWKPYAQVAAGRTGATASPAASPRASEAAAVVSTAGEVQWACAQCGRVFPQREMLEYEGNHVCAACKPTFFQRVREGVSLRFENAGFWIRFLAYFVDMIILWIFQAATYLLVMLPVGILSRDNEVVGIVAYLMVSFFNLCVVVLYETWFVGRFAATPGKMALGLRVVRADGSRLSYLRALGRYGAKIISGMVFCIGYLMVAFTEEKRGLHDLICDTRVIRK
ncbi:MAG: RDD family protein [Candidatus Hydrogenedentes bacterium]|nr:RDD family protein [Candidatus Hydrogenedentota bacterium]